MFYAITDVPPHSLKGSNVSPKVKTTKEKGVGARSLTRNTLGVERCARALRCRLGQVTSGSIIHTNLHKPNNKLVNVWLEHFWCMDKPRSYTNSQDSSRPGLGGSHHLPSYSILYAWPQGLHPNVILSRDSQVGSPKIPKIGTPVTLETYNFCVDL
jgi:hypothetical protein